MAVVYKTKSIEITHNNKLECYDLTIYDENGYSFTVISEEEMDNIINAINQEKKGL